MNEIKNGAEKFVKGAFKGTLSWPGALAVIGGGLIKTLETRDVKQGLIYGLKAGVGMAILGGTVEVLLDETTYEVEIDEELKNQIEYIEVDGVVIKVD
ncbi:MAG: hypothetical protein [Caudoviricetes sp.]|nr:MAG: hypothetical protein [Caudoviricetes sp.]